MSEKQHLPLAYQEQPPAIPQKQEKNCNIFIQEQQNRPLS